MLKFISTLLTIAMKVVAFALMLTTFGVVDFFDIDFLD